MSFMDHAHYYSWRDKDINIFFIVSYPVLYIYIIYFTIKIYGFSQPITDIEAYIYITEAYIYTLILFLDKNEISIYNTELFGLGT